MNKFALERADNGPLSAYMPLTTAQKKRGLSTTLLNEHCITLRSTALYSGVEGGPGKCVEAGFERNLITSFVGHGIIARHIAA